MQLSSKTIVLRCFINCQLHSWPTYRAETCSFILYIATNYNKNWYRVFPGGKVGPGRAADHSPPSSAAVEEE
jgi:hypothetical protein